MRHIAVVGPGIVGMPMAALLARAGLRRGDGSVVTVLQRASPTSGWKVDAINAGRSPIGGVEPELDRIVAEAVAHGALRATHDAGVLADADAVLICVQTDKRGTEPDYGPLFEAVDAVAGALARRPPGRLPLVIFESTLAPSSMATVVRQRFARHGLEEGRDVLLGNSPNRVMPGRLVERVAGSDKIVAGLDPRTPERIRRLYAGVVTGGTLHQTNSLTAEVVKTLENAYRDVRIAFAAEIARYCDGRGVDFFALRDAVNARLSRTDAASRDPSAVPSGGLLVPTVGVGGHCLPKDGVLLWWRALEAGVATGRSLILAARRINDAAPCYVVSLATEVLGPLAGRTAALLGTAYRGDSEDTRNSPTLVLARELRRHGCRVALHDPHVHPGDQNLVRHGMDAVFHRELAPALDAADLVIACTPHREYLERLDELPGLAPRALAFVDACNLTRADRLPPGWRYTGIGRGAAPPPPRLVEYVEAAFRAMERGVANELRMLIEFLNAHYADTPFTRIAFAEVRRLAGTCVTGCDIVDPGPVPGVGDHDGFTPELVRTAGG